MASPLFRRVLAPRLVIAAGLFAAVVLGGRLGIALTMPDGGDPAWAAYAARQGIALLLFGLLAVLSTILGATAPAGQPGGFPFLLARPITRGAWLGHVVAGDALVLAAAVAAPLVACGLPAFAGALAHEGAQGASAVALWSAILACLWAGAALGRATGLRAQYAAAFGMLWATLGAGAGVLAAELLRGHAASRLNLLREPVLHAWRAPWEGASLYDVLESILFRRHHWYDAYTELAIGLGAFAVGALVAVVRARKVVPLPMRGRWAGLAAAGGGVGTAAGLLGLVAWVASSAPAWHRVGQGTIEVSLRAPGGAHVPGEVWLSDRILPAQSTVGELLARKPSLVPGSREGVAAFDLRAGTARFERLVTGPYHVCGLTYPSHLAPGPSETGAGSALLEAIRKDHAWARALPVTCALVQMSSATAVVPVGLTVVPPASLGGKP